MNRTILEAVRAMLSDSKLPKTFWAEAVSTAVYVKNRSPTSGHKNMTPYQALNGHKPNVQHFRTFGCMAHAHVALHRCSCSIFKLWVLFNRAQIKSYFLQ
ncbi:Ribonuclease H-like domain [Trinorchestia longiramus]|nr:Ribonuclease H-like domain [Trinorchestia longiramus]